MPNVVAEALTPAAYAPFGNVVMAPETASASTSANQGTARRANWLAPMKNLRPERARLNIAHFRCSPRTPWPLPIVLLEKHPGSTQLFIPMNARRYIVVVARGGTQPDLSTLRAFVATGTQGVSYHPGIWHHPLLALDAETDFTCAVYEDETAGDCEEATVASAEIFIALPQ